MTIDDYLKKGYFIDTYQNLNKKYLDYRILHFCLRNNSNIEGWTDMYIGTEIGKKTKTHQKKFFDWMGMNRNYSTISNLEP
ncbi:hypothetical protein GW17_00024929, partial [Ensete ventricosum]